MKKILVPCDFSEPSIEALKVSISIAKKSKGKVIVLHAIDSPMVSRSAFGTPQYTYSPEFVENMRSSAQQSFARLEDIYKDFKDVEFLAEEGFVIETINRYSRSEKADVVVMGTHGASGWTEFLIGSNTEKIVRTSTVPIIAVRKFIDVNSIKNIVFPCSFNVEANDAISKLKELQEFLAATLHILYVITPANFKRDFEVMGELNKMATHYKLKDYTLTIRNDYNEQDGIINFAREINADMIAMFTHGRRGLAHIFNGSIAEDVLNHTNHLIWTSVIKEQ